MNRRAHQGWGAGLLTAAVVLGATGHARAEQAQAMFDRGLKAMLESRYDTGCPAIEESYRLDPLPGALFTLAACYERWGKLQRAVERYEAFVQQVDGMSADEQAKQKKRVRTAKDKLGRLGPQVPKLILVFDTPPPADVVVTIDGQSVAPGDLGQARPVDPGEHEIVVRTVDGRVDETVVPVGIAVTRTVTLRLPGDEASSTAGDEGPAEGGGGWTGMHTGAVVVAGVGVVGLVVGGITGGMVFAKKGVVDDNCDGQICTPEGADAASAGKDLAMVSNVTFAIGAAGIVGGAVLWLVAPSLDAGAADSARARLTVGAVAGDPASAVLGVGGVF